MTYLFSIKRRPRLLAATGAANLVSYLGIALVVWFTYPAQALKPITYLKLSEVLVNTHRLRLDVSDFLDAHKRFPDSLAELGTKSPWQTHFSRRYSDLAFEKNGRIVLRLHDMNDPLFDGKRIEYDLKPHPESRKLLWFCSSPDIEPRFLPRFCREPAP